MLRDFCEYVHMPWKFVRNLIIAVIAGIVFLMLFSMVTYTVQEDEAAVVYRMGEIVGIEESPGLKTITPILCRVEKFPISQQYLDVSKSEVLTKDKKNYVIDTYVVWRIVDLPTFVRTAKTLSYAEEYIDSTVYGITKRVMGQHTQDALIGVGYETGRDVANQEITVASNETVAGLGIEIISVETKALDVPSENENAIYERMISERKQSAEAYRAAGELSKAMLINEADREIVVLKAEAEKTAEQLRGEAEAEYMRIWAEAYDTPEKVEFYEFGRSLEALEEALKGKNGKTLILSNDSALAEIISGE